ncbi:MAG: hypothetical protein FWE50_03590 [Alphaproteobacteria bacterium]|nr:hypothetical protein [Alphaproteobacteria bacterium]
MYEDDAIFWENNVAPVPISALREDSAPFLEDDDTPFFIDNPVPAPDDLFVTDEDIKPHPYMFIVDGEDVLKDKNPIPLYGNVFYLETWAEDGALLFKNSQDNQKYFLYKSENYGVLHPFDTPTFYKLFDAEDRSKFLLYNELEFIHKGKNLFADMSIDPWFVDKQTGEIKSLFKFDGSQLHYKIGSQKFFLKNSEDFETPHPYKWMIGQKYGYKIQGIDNTWYFEHNPKNKIYLGNITGYNGAFLDIISYEKVYEQDPEKYNLLKKTVFKLLANIISQSCKCEPNDIHIPHKTIVCAFKCNSDKIDGIIKKLTSNRTPTGKVSKKKPEKLTSGTDVLNAVGTLARMLNYGLRPDMDFYNCNTCPSESVCIYKERMTKFYEEVEKLHAEEALQDYIQKHKGQFPLFPIEILQQLNCK